MPSTISTAMNKLAGSFVLLLCLVLCETSLSAAKCMKPEELPLHEIYITNSMSHSASVRCFRYGFTGNYLGNKWLKPGAETKFIFRYELLGETIYYCTTTNGSFVGYRQSYDCAQNKVNLCEWRIHETYAELYSLIQQRWLRFNYEPPKSPTCYEDLCLRFPRGYPSHKGPCHKENSKAGVPEQSPLSDLSPK